MEGQTVVEISKWASLCNHVKHNRIEYLLCVGILHLLGVTAKVHSQVSGVCI